MKDLSFQEKSVWFQLITVAAFGALYFNRVANSAYTSMAEVAWYVGGLVVWIIIANIIFYAVITAQDKPEEEDERDRLVANRATALSSWILAVSVWIAIGQIVVGDALGEARGPWHTSFVTANILLFGVVASEITRYVLQLRFYRRGF